MATTRLGRRPVLAALLTAGALTLSSCSDSGGVGGAQNAEQNASGSTANLTYWTWFPAEPTLKKVLAAYEKENPGVTVTLRTFQDADYQKQLPLALNGGESIDVVGVQVSAMTNAARTQLRPVQEWEQHLPDGWRDQLEASPLKQAQEVAEDDTLYSIPMGSIGSAVMYYNAAMLKEVGVTAPTTLEELVAVSAAIRKAKPDVTPVVSAGDGYWQGEMLFSIAGQTSPTLSNEILDGSTGWDDPALVKGLESYRKLFTSGAMDTSVLSLKSPRPSELFTSGKAAILFDGSWQNSLLSTPYRTANKIALDNVGAAPVPVVEAGGKPAMRAFAEGGLAIPKSSKNVEAAAKLIAYLTVGDGVELWAPDLVLSPSKKGFTPRDDVLATPEAKEGYAAVSEAINTAGSNRDSRQDFLNAVEGNAILDVLQGKRTAQAAADEMQKQWTSGRYSR